MNSKDNLDDKRTSGHNPTFWFENNSPIKFSKLDKNMDCDVVIVGGGIAGISIAYAMGKSGKKVVLVEDGFIASGETGRTTAHVVSAVDNRYYKLEEIYGTAGTKLIAESYTSAIDRMESWVRNEKINCQFKRVDGYLFLHPSDDSSSLKKEYDSAVRAGLDVKLMHKIPGINIIQGDCICFHNQAQFHPILYLKGLSGACAKYGTEIFTETHAIEIDHTGILTKDGFRVNAEFIVVATNSPVNNKYAMHLKQFSYRTYVIGSLIKKGSVPEALWWDTGDKNVNKDIPPYHFIRLQSFNDDFDLLISGGGDHPTGLADAEFVPEENRYGIIEDWTRRYFPISKVLYRWSGQIMEPMDGIAYIGRNPYDKENVFIVTGDSGNGITHASIAAQLITDLVNNVPNRLEHIYSPSRFKLFKTGGATIKEFFKEFKDYLKTSPKDLNHQLINVGPGEGKIIELDHKKYGIYCDEEGSYHIVNAKCSHLQCIVKWNNDEKSWDCPCHGSRFTHEGIVINGPANIDLEYSKTNLLPDELTKRNL